MDDTINQGAGTDLAAKADAELKPMAEAVEATFAELGRSVTEELARVSADGQRSIRDMVDGILEDLARLAAKELIEDPLKGIFTQGDSSAASLDGFIKSTVRNG